MDQTDPLTLRMHQKMQKQQVDEKWCFPQIIQEHKLLKDYLKEGGQKGERQKERNWQVFKEKRIRSIV